MPTLDPKRKSDHVRRWRKRLRGHGFKDVLVFLPRDTLALVAEFQARNGLKSRSDAINQLITERRQIEKQAP